MVGEIGTATSQCLGLGGRRWKGVLCTDHCERISSHARVFGIVCKLSPARKPLSSNVQVVVSGELSTADVGRSSQAKRSPLASSRFVSHPASWKWGHARLDPCASATDLVFTRQKQMPTC